MTPHSAPMPPAISVTKSFGAISLAIALVPFSASCQITDSPASALLANEEIRAFDQFEFEMYGSWTPQLTEDQEPDPQVLLRLHPRQRATQPLAGPNGTTLSVLRAKSDESSLWEVALGRHPNADPVSQTSVISADGASGWLWIGRSDGWVDALIGFSENDDEYGLHLRAPDDGAPWTTRLLAAGRSFHWFDRSPATVLSGIDLSPRRRQVLQQTLLSDKRLRATPIGDRGLLLHYLRPGAAFDLAAHGEAALIALERLFPAHPSDDQRAENRVIVVRCFDNRKSYSQYGRSHSTEAEYSPDNEEILMLSRPESSDDLHGLLQGLLWAWHIDVSSPSAVFPRWMKYGYMTALRHVDLTQGPRPELNQQRRFAGNSSWLRSGDRLTAEKLVNTSHREFSSRGSAYTDAESFVLFLLAVVPEDPELDRRFGGRLDRATEMALSGAQPQAINQVILGDDADALDVAWRSWVLTH